MQKAKRIPALVHGLTETSIIEDEYVRELAAEGRANVFLTDEAAAAIMCSTRASYSWDVQIKKFQTMLFIDKRDEEGAQNMLDCQTVSESAPNDYTPVDDDSINGVRQLMKETAKVHQELLQATQDSKKFEKLERDDPHEEAED